MSRSPELQRALQDSRLKAARGEGMDQPVPGRARKEVRVYRAACDNCICIAQTDVCLSMPEARELHRQLGVLLRVPPNCIHGYDVREDCPQCPSASAAAATCIDAPSTTSI